MIAHRRGRILLIAEEIDPFPARRAGRLIRLPPRHPNLSASVVIRADGAGHDSGPKLEEGVDR